MRGEARKWVLQGNSDYSQNKQEKEPRQSGECPGSALKCCPGSICKIFGSIISFLTLLFFPLAFFFLLLFFPSIFFLPLLLALFSQSFSAHHHIKIVHFCNKNFLKIAKKQKYYTFIGKQKNHRKTVHKKCKMLDFLNEYFKSTFLNILNKLK